MAGTVTETKNTIAKVRTTEDDNVWEVIMTYVLDASAGGDEIQFTLPVNGILQKVIAKSGAATGITGTFVLAIDDNGGNEIFTSAGPAEGATSKFNVTEPVSDTIVIGVNPNDDPTSGTWTITITLRGI